MSAESETQGPKRHVVAIAMARSENNSTTQCNYVTTALCNDGTMWWIRDVDTEWREMPEIPQYEIKHP